MLAQLRVMLAQLKIKKKIKKSCHNNLQFRNLSFEVERNPGVLN